MCSFKPMLFLSVSVSLSALLLTVCVSLLSPCLCVSRPSLVFSVKRPAVVYLRAARLGSHNSYDSVQRCFCYSVPHQYDCSQLRQSPSILLPLYWPKLTAGRQVRATAGPEYSEYDTIRIKTPFNPRKKSCNNPKSLSTTSSSLARSLTQCPRPHHFLLHASAFLPASPSCNPPSSPPPNPNREPVFQSPTTPRCD